MKFPDTIILAAGHGGKDSGAVSPDGKHNERDQAILIVDAAAATLRAVGLRVVIPPHSLDTHETIPWLNNRYNFGDAWALEIHRDSAPSIKDPDASLRCGVYHGSSKNSVDVAERLVAGMKKGGATRTSWARNQSVSRFSRLGWIAQPKCLSHLVELGFMQGQNNKEHLMKLAGILAGGVIAVIRG